MINDLRRWIDGIDLIDIILLALMITGILVMNAVEDAFKSCVLLATMEYYLARKSEAISLDANVAFTVLITASALLFLGMNWLRRSLWREYEEVAEANDYLLNIFRMHMWQHYVNLALLDDNDNQMIAKD